LVAAGVAFGHLKKHHILAAGLASLAAAVAIGAGALMGDGSGGSTAASSAPFARQAQAVVEPEMTLYVVRTQADADMIRSAFGVDGDYESVEIIVGEGPHVDLAIADAAAIRRDLRLPELKVYDLRYRE
jgi:hypothetical protein